MSDQKSSKNNPKSKPEVISSAKTSKEKPSKKGIASKTSKKVSKIESSLEMNPDFERAVDIILNSDKNLFITGRAGTGKSTLLRYVIESMQKNVVVLAPTGLAAINVGGQTIHSFLKLKPGGTLADAKKSGTQLKSNKLIKELDTIIIDEVSMVRADLMDMVDICLKTARDRIEPFGGVQMVFIGDLYQLPPVLKSDEAKVLKEIYITPYFFSSKVVNFLLEELGNRLEFVELRKIYRQSDADFIDLLNKIRYKDISDQELLDLNMRTNPNWHDLNDGHILLTTRNDDASKINSQELAKLETDSEFYEGELDGEFKISNLPTEMSLELKVGARVIFVKNDLKGRWVNGSLGYVQDLHSEYVEVVLDSGRTVDVGYETWEMRQARYDEEIGGIVNEEVGSFTQLPLKLCWAMTIHKAQGQTFEKVILDLGRGAFSTGQTYVALSRCVSLEGLVLARAIKKSDIRTDYKVSKFLTYLEYQLALQKLPREQKIQIIEEAIKNAKNLKMVYLKAKNVRDERTLKPRVIEDREYKGIKFLALEGFCLMRNENRVFNVDRILEISIVH